MQVLHLDPKSSLLLPCIPLTIHSQFSMQAIGSGGLSSWNIETVDASPEDKQNSGISEQTRILQQQSKKGRRRGKNKRAAAQSDSEEEDTITMQSVD